MRREGRITRAQSDALECLWPEYGVDLEPGAFDLETVFARDCPVIAEIGFGNGGALLAMAAENPQCNFLGIEVYRPGVGSLLLSLKRLGITNVRIVMEDAVLALQNRLRNECLSKILIFFPDPWPKKRHHKRRLLQAGFLDSAVRCLQPGGHIHIVTDWEDYANHISSLLQNEQRLLNNAGEGRFIDRPAYRPQTKYEDRGTARGHKVWDMVYERKRDSGKTI